jgi:hypothetical protein
MGRHMQLTCLTLGALLTLSAANAGAQKAPVPCKQDACMLTIDWGAGRTSATYPPDKRYGSGDDFESRFRAALAERGFRFRDGPMSGVMVMTVRPTMRARVMCDQMAGLNPDMNCTAMTQLAVNFTSPDPSIKAPGAIRLSNRCAAGDIYIGNREFGQYSADMIWYQLEGQAAKAERPRVNC